MLVIDERRDKVEAGRGFGPAGVRGIGLVGLAFTLWLWVAMTRGAHRIDRLITAYEQAHGPLDLSDGVLAHHTDAIRQLCDDVVAAGSYFYPFGWLLFLVAAAGWCFFSALALHDRAKLMIAFWVSAGLALAIQLFLYAAPVYEMTIITE